MENDILKKLKEHDKILIELQENSRKTKKFARGIFIVFILSIILPIIGLLVAIPQFISIYSSIGSF